MMEAKKMEQKLQSEDYKDNTIDEIANKAKLFYCVECGKCVGGLSFEGSIRRIFF